MKNLWKATSQVQHRYPSVCEPIHVDAVVVGGGYTGLSAAFHLARSGANVALLEAGVIGEGASGRNGGQVVPHLKVAPEQLARKYGTENATRMLHLAQGSADFVFSLIDELKIDCDPTRNGWIQTSFSTASKERLRILTRQKQRSGADVQFLEQEEILEATGSNYFNGGLLERRAGAVHPMKFARGLANACQVSGAALYEHSRVEAIEPVGSRWSVRVNGHWVAARTVILATDAYTDQWAGPLSRSMLTVTSAQIATEPLSTHLLDGILPRRAGVSDARKLTHYCRIDPEGRFVIGGRSSFKDDIDQPTADRLRRAALARFPQLADSKWSHSWLGRVGITLDEVPHVGQQQEGLWTAYGYGGNGVALSVRLGAVLAKAALGADLCELDYPVTGVKALPFFKFRRPVAAAAISWYIAREALGFPK